MKAESPEREIKAKRINSIAVRQPLTAKKVPHEFENKETAKVKRVRAKKMEIRGAERCTKL